MEEITLPIFLNAEHWNKDKAEKDRIFITSPKYLSLIEIFDLGEKSALITEGVFSKTFYYYADKYNSSLEEYQFVLIQNNFEIANEEHQEFESIVEFMDSAWEYFKEYLIWEDSQ